MRPRHAGFTVIECVVVLAIIVILAAILGPVFAKAKAKAEAYSVLCEIGLKRLRQVSAGEPSPSGLADAGLVLLSQAETCSETNPLIIGKVAFSGQEYVRNRNGRRWRVTAKEGGLAVADAMIQSADESAGFTDLLFDLYEYHGRNRKELWTTLGLSWPP